MRSNSLLALLVGVLCVCGLATLWLSVRYYFSIKELQKVEGRIITMNTAQRAAQSLALEAVAYGRRNPAIMPLLQQFELVKTNAPGTEPSAPAQP